MEKIYRWWVLIHWVIGNGESRKHIDINKLEGITYGCNAIYRDYFTDYVFCKDKGISNEVTFSGIWKDRRVYFQHRWRNDSESREAYNRICDWDQEYPDCGTAALRTAASYAVKYLNDEWKYPEGASVHMIGFDYDTSGKMNNIYKGTNNYLMKENPRTWPSKQFLETFEMYPQLEFVQYGNWSKLLDRYENVRLAWYFVLVMVRVEKTLTYIN